VVFLTESTQNALGQLPKTSEYVFTHNNQPLSSRYCQSRLKSLGNKCDVQVTPHQLRHTCATMLLNAGMSILGVQAILGHIYVDTTLRYARVHDSVIAKDYKHALKIKESAE
jgi:site-specific recombinase XerD